MKKKYLKSLSLRKTAISKVTLTGGTYRTADCYSVNICHAASDTDNNLEIIVIPNALNVFSILIYFVSCILNMSKTFS